MPLILNTFLSLYKSPAKVRTVDVVFPFVRKLLKSFETGKRPSFYFLAVTIGSESQISLKKETSVTLALVAKFLTQTGELVTSERVYKGFKLNLCEVTF